MKSKKPELQRKEPRLNIKHHGGGGGGGGWGSRKQTNDAGLPRRRSLGFVTRTSAWEATMMLECP